MKLSMKKLIINLSILVIVSFVLLRMIGMRVETSLRLIQMNLENENLLSEINSDIIYEERNNNELTVYKIHEYNKIKHMILDRNEEQKELYEFNGRVFKYDDETDKYTEYDFDNEENNDEEFRDTLNALDYVYNFCNELTFMNYVKSIQENRPRTRLKLNRYRVDIEQDYMFNGSQNIELYTDYFGRVLNGIYYREPVGKWTRFIIGKEVKKVKLPKQLEAIRLEIENYEK